MSEAAQSSTLQRLTSLALLLLGAGFAWIAMGYGLGTLTSMRPGFFPFVLGLALAVFAAIDLVQTSITRARSGGGLALELRRTVLVCVSLISFALLLHRAGLVPAIFVSSLLATRAEPDVKWLVGVLYSAALAALSYSIFVLGLGLPVRTFGW